MMLEHLGEVKAAKAIENAVMDVTANKLKDMGAGKMGYSTTEVGDLVLKGFNDTGAVMPWRDPTLHRSVDVGPRHGVAQKDVAESDMDAEDHYILDCLIIGDVLNP